MMDAALSEWLDSIGGLDRTGWWMPVVCAHADRLSDAEVVGVLFDHSERGGLRWAPRWDGTRYLIHLTRLDDTERQTVRALGAEGQVTFGLGSINTVCSLGHTARFTREQWDEKITAARESSAVVLDVFR